MTTAAFIGQKGYPPEFEGTSGIEFYVAQKIEEHIKKGIRSVVYTRFWASKSTTTRSKYIHVVRLPSINTKHLDTLTHSLFCSIHVCFTKTDTVWFQAIGPTVWAWIPKMCGKKIKTTIHGLDWKRKKWGVFARAFLKLSEKTAIWFSDELIVVSKKQKKYFLKKYRKNSILDVLSKKKGKKARPRIITKKYGLKGNDYILYMGRFVPEKRIEWLIRAYKEIQPKGIKLVLAGGSSHSDGYVRRLYKLAGIRDFQQDIEKDNNPTIRQSDNIVFCGWVFGREKEELLSNCLFFVLPSELEGSPVVINEVLAYGRLCLVSHTIGEMNNINIIVFQNTYKDFKAKIKQMIWKIR